MKLATKTTTGISMDASFNGDPFSIARMDGFSISAKWTESVATLEGTLKLQASNNAFNGNVGSTESQNINTDAQWDDIDGSDEAVSGSGQVTWNVSAAYYTAVRVVWTSVTGEGSVDLIYSAKGII